MKKESVMPWDVIGPIVAVVGLLAFSIFVLPRLSKGG